MLKKIVLRASCLCALAFGGHGLQGFMAYQEVQKIKTLNLTEPKRFVFDFYSAQAKAMAHWEQLIRNEKLLS